MSASRHTRQGAFRNRGACHASDGDQNGLELRVSSSASAREPLAPASQRWRSPPTASMFGHMLDRRQFLSATAAGAALTLIGATRVEHDASSDSLALAHPELLVALGANTVREIGEAYRALVLAEHDRASLEAALRAELHAARSSDEDPIRADFAAG